MNKAAAWTINGVGFDARAAAREAARRQGLSLGDWLNRVIADHAADLGVDEDSFDASARIEAIKARLESLGSGPGKRGDDHRPRAARHEPHRFGRRDPATEGDRHRGRDDRDGDGPTRREADSLLDEAITAMERRAARSERKADRALASFARIVESTESRHEAERDMFADLGRRLTEMESRLARRVTDDNPIRTMLAKLETRLETLSRPAPAPEPPKAADDEPIRRLEAKLNTLIEAVAKKPEPMQTSAIAATAARTAQAAVEEPSVAVPAFADRRLGAAIAGIAHQQRALARDAAARQRPASVAAAPAAPAPAASGGLLGLQEEIGALGAKIDGMRRMIARDGIARARDAAALPIEDLRADVATISKLIREQPAHDALPRQISAMTDALEAMRHDLAQREDERRDVASRAEIEALKSEIEDLSRNLSQLAPASTISTLERSIRALTARLEASRDGDPRATIQPLESAVGNLRQSLKDGDTEGVLGHLEREMRSIGGKVEGLSGVESAALSRIQTQTQEIRDLLSAAAHPPAIDRIERELAVLAERIDRRPEPASAQGQVEAVQAVAADIRALFENPPSPLFDKIERRLEALTGKIDQAITEAAEARALAEQSKRHLGDVEEQLAARSDDAVAAPGTDVRSLENLVRDLAARIEAVRAPDGGAPAIEALQEQILRLSNRFERADSELSALATIERSMQELFAQIEETRAGVETAAARAAREAARAALAEGAPLDPKLARELATLKAVQEEADHRTRATLDAVHETLEKIVDRLSFMEGEKPGALDLGLEAPKGRPARVDLPDLMLDPAAGFERPAPEAMSLDEPMAPFGARRNAAADLDEAAGHADFIAAARHAARSAQSDPSVLAMKRPAAPSEVRASLMAKSRDYVSSHKKPVLLSIAALFVLVGTLAVMSSLKTGDEPSRLAEATPPARVAQAMPEPAMPAPTMPAPTTPAPARVAGGPVSASAADLTPSALPKAPAPAGGALPGSDPIETGSIKRLPSFIAQGLSGAAVTPGGTLKDLADRGNAAAQYEIGSRYAEGRRLVKDFKLAALWYEKAAEQGLAPAQYKLASLYERGLGVPKDKAKARAWYLKAAEAGNPRAMHNLAVLVADGDGKPDYADAVTWFRKAAEYGVHDSQYNLAILLARGLGTPQSLIQSYQWFAIAARQNDADAAAKRDEVASKLSPADLAVAKALADSFHPKTADVAATEIDPPPGGWDGASSPSLVKSARPKLSSL